MAVFAALCGCIVLFGRAGRTDPGPASSIDTCVAASDNAQTLRDGGKYLEARAAFRICSQTICPAVVQRNCIRMLDALEEGLPTVVLAARAADGSEMANDTSVQIDGAPGRSGLTGTALPIDPGHHVFTFHHHASVAKVETLINVGEKNRLIVGRFSAVAATVPAAPPSPASPDAREHGPSRGAPVAPIDRGVTIGLGALGVASVVAFIVVGANAFSDLRAIERSPCATMGTCSHDEVSSIRTRFAVADVALASGVAMLAAASLVWWFSRR